MTHNALWLPTTEYMTASQPRAADDRVDEPGPIEPGDWIVDRVGGLARTAGPSPTHTYVVE